jgi:hypothetical protein
MYMSKPLFSWSFSAVQSFLTCPRKFYNERVLKRYPFEKGEAALYGERMHKAVELYGKFNAPLPTEFAFVKSQVDVAKAATGTKSWEQKFALTQDMQPCEYFAKDAWLRAQVDYLCINGDTQTALVADWKSGKSSHADTSQLELMALIVFKRYPQVREVRAGLSFLTERKFVPAHYTRANEGEYWQRWYVSLAKMKAAYESGTWNPKPSGLCKKWCPVLECEFNGRNRE